MDGDEDAQQAKDDLQQRFAQHLLKLHVLQRSGVESYLLNQRRRTWENAPTSFPEHH